MAETFTHLGGHSLGLVVVTVVAGQGHAVTAPPGDLGRGLLDRPAQGMSCLCSCRPTGDDDGVALVAERQSDPASGASAAPGHDRDPAWPGAVCSPCDSTHRLMFLHSLESGLCIPGEL